MRYIRTKDRIYEVEENIMLTSLPPQYKVKGICKGISEKNVIKQADTIEKLCDEIVVIFPNGEKNIWSARAVYSCKELKEVFDIDFTEEEIYYAIWTDKGLIYVAKMNDKGELELL